MPGAQGSALYRKQESEEASWLVVSAGLERGTRDNFKTQKPFRKHRASGSWRWPGGSRSPRMDVSPNTSVALRMGSPGGDQ